MQKSSSTVEKAQEDYAVGRDVEAASPVNLRRWVIAGCVVFWGAVIAYFIA